MEESSESRRRRRKRLLVIGAPVAALAIVLALMAAEVAPGRLRPVGTLLGVAVAASLAQLAVSLLSARRARRLRAHEVPWGIRLRRPLWLSTPEVGVAVELGAILAALVALCGAPGIGAGVLLLFAVIGLSMPLFQLHMSPRALTFEDGGLRVHLPDGEFLVPWPSITAVDTIGPDHMQFTTLRLADADAIAAVATPATPRLRERVATILSARGSAGQLLLLHWTGGLDGRTLARALEAGRRGRGGQVN